MDSVITAGWLNASLGLVAMAACWVLQPFAAGRIGKGRTAMVLLLCFMSLALPSVLPKAPWAIVVQAGQAACLFSKLLALLLYRPLWQPVHSTASKVMQAIFSDTLSPGTLIPRGLRRAVSKDQGEPATGPKPQGNSLGSSLVQRRAGSNGSQPDNQDKGRPGETSQGGRQEKEPQDSSMAWWDWQPAPPLQQLLSAAALNGLIYEGLCTAAQALMPPATPSQLAAHKLMQGSSLTFWPWMAQQFVSRPGQFWQLSIAVAMTQLFQFRAGYYAVCAIAVAWAHALHLAVSAAEAVLPALLGPRSSSTVKLVQMLAAVKPCAPGELRLPPVPCDAPWRSASLGELWGRRWHSYFRSDLLNLAGHPTHAIVLLAAQRLGRHTPQGAVLARTLASAASAVACFALSGLIHEYMAWAAFGWCPGGHLAFFLVHGMAAVAERLVWGPRSRGRSRAQAARGAGGSSSGSDASGSKSSASRGPGVVLTVLFCLATTPLFSMPWVAAGYVHDMPRPVLSLAQQWGVLQQGSLWALKLGQALSP